MAVVKVSGKVSKVFGASNQGLSLVESYKSATGEDYTRTYTVWFAVAHGVAEGQEVTVFGQLSTKIEDYEGAQSILKLSAVHCIKGTVIFLSFQMTS